MKHKWTALWLTLALFFTLLAGCEALQPPTQSQGTAPSPGETLTVHFIDVGQADAALLLCGGETMLIDGGNAEDSSLLVSYLEDLGVEHLDYVVCSHAHEDHVGGLSGPLNTCTAGAVWSPVSEYSSKAFGKFVQYAEAQGLSPVCPEVDSTYNLGDALITVLGPREDYSDTNNTSIVLRVDFGETSFLFTGDMEQSAEADLVDAGCNLKATVLKVGHHGSDTSSSYRFLREVLPEYAVISVGTGNSYGHPNDEILSRLYDEGAAVYRTDLLGSIVAVSDGTTVNFTTGTGGGPDLGQGSGTSSAAHYIGNRNSQVFHLETCSSLPSEQNRVEFSSRSDAVAQGYKPCGTCKP